MQKVLIVGSPGSGKSTFGKRLAARTGLSLIHLDRLFWEADGTFVSSDLFDARLDAELQRPEGIIDGSYLRTLPQRLAWCDTVFFMDLPVDVCLAGIRQRRGVKRSDLPWVEDPINIDVSFETYVAQFPIDQRPSLIAYLEAATHVDVITFTRYAAADQWLETHTQA